MENASRAIILSRERGGAPRRRLTDTEAIDITKPCEISARRGVGEGETDGRTPRWGIVFVSTRFRAKQLAVERGEKRGKILQAIRQSPLIPLLKALRDFCMTVPSARLLQTAREKRNEEFLSQKGYDFLLTRTSRVSTTREKWTS